MQLDKLIGEDASRSAFIEKVLSERLSEMERDAINLRDMELINAAADRLNAEAKDVLEDQDAWYFDPMKEQNSGRLVGAGSFDEQREQR